MTDTTFLAYNRSNDFMERSDRKNRLLPREVSAGFDVARFLNEEEDQIARAGVLRIFELCRELDKLRREREALFASFGPLNVDDLNKNEAQSHSVLRRVNNLLNTFHFTPFLVGMEAGDILWKPRSTPGAEPGTIPTASFVKRILEMTTAGTIDRVRQCICDRWFLAATNKKMVCSDACRFKKFKEDHQGTFNEERAEYMRDYRKTVKTRKEKRSAKTK